MMSNQARPTGFIGKIATLSAAVGVAGLSSFAAFLIVAAKLPAAEFGILSVHLTISGLVVSIITLRVDFIIPKIAAEEHRIVLHEAFSLLLLLSPLACIPVYLIYQYYYLLDDASILYIFTLIHSIIFAFFQINNAINISKMNTAAASLATSMQGILFLTFCALLFFFETADYLFFLIAHSASFLIAFLNSDYRSKFFFVSSISKIPTIFPVWYRSNISDLLSLSAQSIINAVSMNVLLMLVFRLSDIAALGLFSIAHRVLSFPIRVFATPIRQIMTSYYKNSIMDIKPVLKVSLISFIFLLSATLVAFLIGLRILDDESTKVYKVTEIAIYLAPWFAAVCSAIPLIIYATNRSLLHKYTIYEILNLLGRIVSYYISTIFSFSLSKFIVLFGALNVVSVIIFAYLLMAGRKSKS